MQLGKLKSAIRVMKGNPSVHVPIVGDFVVVQKGAIMESLDRAFENKASETGLMLTPNGRIVADGLPVAGAFESTVVRDPEGKQGMVAFDLLADDKDLFGEDLHAEEEDLLGDLLA